MINHSEFTSVVFHVAGSQAAQPLQQAQAVLGAEVAHRRDLHHAAAAEILARPGDLVAPTAALGEEIGYAGCGLVVVLYLSFFYRGFRVADSQKDPFAQFLAAGLISVFAFQTLLNIGGVTKALPLTGITLPFVSHGGSSLLTSFIALGLLLALSEGGRDAGRGGRTAKKKNAAE